MSKFGINPNDLVIFTKPKYQVAYQKRKLDIKGLVNVSQNQKTK